MKRITRVERAYKDIASTERWLKLNMIRQDDIDRELRQGIFCWNLSEESERRLLEWFAVG